MILAVLVAPLATLPAMCLGVVLRDREAPFDLGVLLVMAILYLPFAYFGSVALGLPAHFALRRSRVSAWWYGLVGSAIALAVGVIPGSRLFASGWDWFAIAIAGLLSGLVFRMILGPEPNPRLNPPVGSVTRVANGATRAPAPPAG